MNYQLRRGVELGGGDVVGPQCLRCIGEEIIAALNLNMAKEVHISR